MSRVEDLPVGTALVYLVVLFGLVIGWIMNIAALAGSPELAKWTVLEVLRVVGIFVAPLGGVLGWL